VVSPSQLNEKWFTDRKPSNLKNIRLLYVGRIKIEKGVFSLLKILNEIKLNFTISIINSEKFHDKKLESEKVKIVYFQNKDDSIIKVYDDYNIFILPSYTEGHPQVLDESLSRLRPVIIFPEISHVKRNREGVFVAERNVKSLSKKIEYVMGNYEVIQKQMMQNKLPNKISFLQELREIISKK
jgi:glycosyltransferase involved in cell wall biosynthesis